MQNNRTPSNETSNIPLNLFLEDSASNNTKIEKISPLSKQGREERKVELNIIGLNSKKRLFDIVSEASTNTKKEFQKRKFCHDKENKQNNHILSSIPPKNIPTTPSLLNFDFRIPFLQLNTDESLQLNDLVGAIYKSFQTREISQNIVSKIQKIELDPFLSHEKKMAQLGALFYFLDRGATFEEEENINFISLRIEELNTEINRLKSTSDECKIIPTIPHYLLLAFARMVVVDNGRAKPKLNIGGIYSIIEILTDCQAGINNSFLYNHLNHIIFVCNHLIKSSKCRNLIENEIKLAPDMDHLIRLQLLIRQRVKLDSVDIMRACVMALFSDLRQGITPNCFIIGITKPIIQSELNINKILKSIIELLKSGLNVKQISLWPLISKRLEEESPLYKQIEVANLPEIVPIQHVYRMIGMKFTPCDEIEENKDSSNHFASPLLIDSLLTAAEINKKEMGDILHTVNAFIESPLMKALFTKAEFLNANQMNAQENNKNFSPWKKELIDVILKPFKNAKVNKCIHMEWLSFCEFLKTCIGQNIWFEDTTEHNIASHLDRLYIGPMHNQRVIENLEKDDINRLKNAYQFARYLIFIEKGQFKRIESITEFRQILEKITSSLFAVPIWNLKIKDQASKILNSDESIKLLIELSALQTQVPETILVASNRLFFKQMGGFAENLLLHFFQVPFNTSGLRIDFRQTNHMTTFLQDLQKILMIPKNMDEVLPMIAASNKNHTFCVDVNRCKLHLNKEVDIQKEINHMFEISNEFLDKKIPLNIQLQVITQLNVVNELSHELNMKLSKAGMTYSEFRSLIFENQTIISINNEDIESIIDREFYKVNIDQNILIQVLMKHGINNFSEELKHRLVEIEKKFTPFSAYPFQIADELAELFTDFQLPTLDPHELEETILYHCGLSHTYYLFDTNYYDYNYYNAKTQSRSHIPWIVRIHLGSSKLEFLQREKHLDSRVSLDPFETLLIYQLN